jgi:hypothetical protein
MKAVAWMIGVSTASWLAARAIVGATAGVAVLFGMLGPLFIATTTWLMMERTHRERPDRLTSVMVTAFAVKMVFFGAYVALALRVLSLPPAPFVASFISYFIALHAAEAVCLRRLTTNVSSR